MPEPIAINSTKICERKPRIKAAEANNETVIIAEKSGITSKRLPAVSLADAIENPGVARANAAVSVEKPEGDLEWARKCDGYVCLRESCCLQGLSLLF
jgi:peroxygenase